MQPRLLSLPRCLSFRQQESAGIMVQTRNPNLLDQVTSLLQGKRIAQKDVGCNGGAMLFYGWLRAGRRRTKRRGGFHQGRLRILAHRGCRFHTPMSRKIIPGRDHSNVETEVVENVADADAERVLTQWRNQVVS